MLPLFISFTLEVLGELVFHDISQFRTRIPRTYRTKRVVEVKISSQGGARRGHCGVARRSQCR